MLLYYNDFFLMKVVVETLFKGKKKTPKKLQNIKSNVI